MPAASRALLGLALALIGALPTAAAAQQSVLQTQETVAQLEPLPKAQPFPAQAQEETEGALSPSLGVGGPTVQTATSGFHFRTNAESGTAQDAANAAAHSGGLGTGGALMIVGGAALLAGLIIGGGAGTAVAIGGVLVGAYGLYIFLR
jgi:hypothetical protein